MAQLSAIDAINGVLVDESGRALPDTILRNTRETSLWMELVDSGIWPEHLGAVISIPTYEATSAGSATWTKVRPVDASGESVSPTASTITSAKTIQSFDLYQTSLKSEKLNVNDLMIAFSGPKQYEAIVANLSENVQRRLSLRNRDSYLGLIKNHVILDSLTSPTEATTIGTAEATLELTNKSMDRYYNRMNLGGAARRPMDRIDNRPIYTLVCGDDVSESLKNSLGENLRYAGRSNELLAPLGVNGVWKNFYHAVDIQAPRFTWSGSVYTEVLPYTTITTGEISAGGPVSYDIPNTAYETAPFTDTIIYHQDVMKQLVPSSSTSGQGSGVSFEPRNYRGDWSWVNIESHLAGAEFNPLRQIGFFYGVFRLAYEPMFPKFGYRIRHLRPGMTN